jgi:UDP-glucose 4-epimerase
MRAVVTGGAGFIGSHLVDALVARGDDVLVVDDLSTGRRERVHPDARFLQLDIRDREGVAGAWAADRPEVCFHLAAQADVRVSVADPARDAEVNVLGTINVLQASHDHETQVVFSSTGGAIYGECEEPAPETAPREPISPYGTSKLAGEEYLAMANRLYGEGHVALRFGNVYGPRQDPHGEAGVVAIFFGRLLEGQPPRIFGDGSQTRDYVYVGDVVRATLLAAGHAGGVFNVGTGVETSVVDLAAACMRVSGVELEPVFEPARLGELQRSVLDPSLSERELGFRTAVDVEAGLAETWRSVSPEGVEAAGAK